MKFKWPLKWTKTLEDQQARSRYRLRAEVDRLSRENESERKRLDDILSQAWRMQSSRDLKTYNLRVVVEISDMVLRMIPTGDQEYVRLVARQLGQALERELLSVNLVTTNQVAEERYPRL